MKKKQFANNFKFFISRILYASLILFFAAACDESTPTEQSGGNIVGTWKGYSMISDTIITFTFTETTFTLETDDELYQGTYTINSESNPMRITFVFEMSGGDQLSGGIFKFESGNLILLINEPGEIVYPENFNDLDAAWFILSKSGLPPMPDYFEFELEYMLPTETGTYTIGVDFEGVDFQNSDAPYNTHAYQGTVTFTSISPNWEGTFTMSQFTAGHGNEPPYFSGQVTGSFSIPVNGDPGTFVATGAVGDYDIDLNLSNAYAETDDSELGFYGFDFY